VLSRDSLLYNTAGRDRGREGETQKEEHIAKENEVRDTECNTLSGEDTEEETERERVRGETKNDKEKKGKTRKCRGKRHMGRQRGEESM
jgi:uncharacterized protein (DUF3084 family)